MKIIDGIFNDKSFVSHTIDDEEYRRLLYQADIFREVVESELSDVSALAKLLDILELCNEVEKKHIFADGVQFVLSLSELI